MRGASPSPRQSPRALRPDPGPAMSFFRRKVEAKENENTPFLKITASTSVHFPQKSTKDHALLEAAGPSHVAINAISANMDSFSSSRTAALKKQPSHMEAAHFGDLGRSCLDYQTQETKSSLSKTLEQVLHDTVVLPYFIQFMELRRMEHLVKFWLEAESFYSTTWSRIRAHSLNTVKQSSLAEPVSPAKKQETTPSFLTESLKRLEDSSSPQLLMTQSERVNLSRTNNIQNHLLRCQECEDVHPFHLEMTRGTYQVSIENQESSRLVVASRNSPLKELSGKLMKSIEQDAVNTFTKYISPDAAKPIPITEAMRNDIIAKICGEDGQVDPNCFVLAQSIVFSAMEQEHFSEFLRSHHFCKYQIEVLTSGTVYLADILFCESALFYFSEYMEKEDAMNILQFWLAGDNFQSQLAAKKGQYDGQEAQNDAMILYDKYFSLQATHPLGFDDIVRLEIESNICREGGPLPNCFTTPLRQAWTTMEKVFLPGFLSSNLYYKFLNDLIHSVRGDEFLGGNVSLTAYGSVGAPDESSPTGTNNSYQSSVKKPSVKILKNFDEAIIVDAASLDPESLYQRTYAGKMTFGRVSDLGQFIRESEPEPDVKKSKGSMFSQAMKKWVQGNTNEAQEELAWKIAKMIVSDVMHQAQYDQPLEKSTKLPAHEMTRARWLPRSEMTCAPQPSVLGDGVHTPPPAAHAQNDGRPLTAHAGGWCLLAARTEDDTRPPATHVGDDAREMASPPSHRRWGVVCACRPPT
ncbi:PREDICTED: A-kinase anchor protein 10, mitochondrial-like [Elephantulus edwardii]|uniref:A-kinase anchor protein 10, mitochondrial-like n=1 Tax=Elephantulus edwardii TaxID=28737 RepID=UPI0003F0A9CF|nr:PREDICTED: A-kinase anchor protein 10, mitochondrial-like [Elephantulus edwardii]